MISSSEAYVEELDVVKDVIVVGEVVASNDLGTGILLGLPVGGTEALASLQKLLLGDLASPVGLGSLLELTVGSHAGEPENGAVEQSSAIESQNPRN